MGAHHKIGHENRTRKCRVAADVLSDPELKSEVFEICAPDVAVWQSFLARERRQEAAPAI